MGEATRIEWTDHTWNPWRGCSRVSPGCDHCYAEALSGRNPAVLGEWGPDGSRAIASEAYWRLPFKWDRAAARAGVRRRVFSLSLGDWLEDRPELARPRARMLATMAGTPNLDYLLLTKRPQHWAALMRQALDAWHPRDNGTKRSASYWWACDWLHGKPPANVWLGVSVEDQARADGRIPRLLEIPAAVRFLSVEPLLEPVDIYRYLFDPNPHREHWPHEKRGLLHWIICGGESGPGARPMHPGWARSIRDQCRAAGVPFFFKQWGEWAPVSRPSDADEIVRASNTYPRGRWLDIDGGNVHRSWETVMVDRVGKKAAVRTLDGREWGEFPEPKGVAR